MSKYGTVIIWFMLCLALEWTNVDITRWPRQTRTEYVVSGSDGLQPVARNRKNIWSSHATVHFISHQLCDLTTEPLQRKMAASAKWMIDLVTKNTISNLFCFMTNLASWYDTMLAKEMRHKWGTRHSLADFSTGLHAVRWMDDTWMMNWEKFGRKQRWPNRGIYRYVSW